MTDLELEKWINRIVDRLTRNFPKHVYDRRDLISAAHVGVLEAKNRFDESQGVPFQKFAYLRVRGAVIDQIRKNCFLSVSSIRYLKMRCAMQEANTNLTKAERNSILSKAKDNALVFRVEFTEQLAIEETPSQSLEEMLDQFRKIKELPSLLSELTAAEQSVVRKYYFKGATFAEIAKDRKMTKSGIWKVHKKALEKLRLLFKQNTVVEAI